MICNTLVFQVNGRGVSAAVCDVSCLSDCSDTGLQVISAWIAGTFFFLFILVVCGLCIRWSSKKQNTSAAQFMEEMSKLTQPATTSMSDKRRAELNEKYGLSG